MGVQAHSKPAAFSARTSGLFSNRRSTLPTIGRSVGKQRRKHDLFDLTRVLPASDHDGNEKHVGRYGIEFGQSGNGHRAAQPFRVLTTFDFTADFILSSSRSRYARLRGLSKLLRNWLMPAIPARTSLTLGRGACGHATGSPEPKAPGTVLRRFTNTPITKDQEAKSGGVPLRPSGARHAGYGRQGRGRIMLPLWCYPTFIVIFAALLYAVWRVWRTEIQVWLIPQSEIREAAENLCRLHGIDNAERKAVANSLEAWRRHNVVEAWRWDRVAHWIRRNTNKELARK